VMGCLCYKGIWILHKMLPPWYVGELSNRRAFLKV
jgi:hypothetical protein